MTGDDAVVEIGAGLGDLTRPLAEVARRIIALEVDRGLVAALAEADLPPNVEIRHEDALEADLGGLARALGPPVMLVGNLPYRIAGRFLGTLLGPRNPFRRWAFMLQAEVADRVLSRPGDPGYGTLSVWTSLWSEARGVLELGPGEFEPRPRVRSRFLVFDPAPSPPAIGNLALLRQVVRAAFHHRRKTLRAALRGRVAGAESALEAAGIDPGRRGETLTAVEFVALAAAVEEAQRKPPGD